jgi:hypothetical protein
MAGHVGQWPTAHGHGVLEARRLTGGVGGARGRLGRGPAGPEVHQGLTCGVGLAGDGPAATNSAVASSDNRGRNGDGRRRFRPPRADSVEGEEEGGEVDLQGTPGKLGEVQNGGGRRRRAWCLRGHAWERERVSQIERGKKRGASWRPGTAPGGHLGLRTTSRRWPRGAPGSRHAGACLLEIEDKGDFSKKNP